MNALDTMRRITAAHNESIGLSAPCRCDAYKFPHRIYSGACGGVKEPSAYRCEACHGYGHAASGDADGVCHSCGGSGEVAA